jgi:hypothetical protein
MAKCSGLAAENRAIKNIQKSHMKEKLSYRYIALENIEIDFVWDERDVVSVDMLWEKGYAIDFIAAEFNRPINDLFALLWDRLEQGFIQERPGGIYGRS